MRQSERFPMRPSGEELTTFLLDWLRDEQPELESDVDLFARMFEELGHFLEGHGTTDDEYCLIISACLGLLDHLSTVTPETFTPETKAQLIEAIKGRCGVQIHRLS